MEKTKARNQVFILIFENFLLKKTINLVQNGIKFNVIGNKKKISKKLQKIINDSEKRTQFNNKLQINVALKLWL